MATEAYPSSEGKAISANIAVGVDDNLSGAAGALTWQTVAAVFRTAERQGYRMNMQPMRVHHSAEAEQMLVLADTGVVAMVRPEQHRGRW